MHLPRAGGGRRPADRLAEADGERTRGGGRGVPVLGRVRDPVGDRQRRMEAPGVTQTGREELLRRLRERDSDRTGFDLAGIRRALGDPEEAATGVVWTRESWERYAVAVERIATTVLKKYEI